MYVSCMYFLKESEYKSDSLSYSLLYFTQYVNQNTKKMNLVI